MEKDFITIEEQIEILKAEFTDRYGKLDEDILLYMESKYLEHLLKINDVETLDTSFLEGRISSKKNRVVKEKLLSDKDNSHLKYIKYIYDNPVKWRYDELYNKF